MLASDFNDELSYTLRNELEVRPDRQMTGVQRQAFQLALQQFAIPYVQKKARLVSKEAGLTLSPFEGLARPWQVTIQNLMNFMDAAFQKLDAKAAAMALMPTDAYASRRVDSWNAWSGTALQNYLDAVRTFGQMVTYATQSAPVPASVPGAFAALARSAGMPAPQMGKGGALGELESNITPAGLFGVALTAGVAGLAWWFAKKTVERPRW